MATDGHSTQVNTDSHYTFKETDGPQRFMDYSLCCLGIALFSLIAFTPFLPRTKKECAEWKLLGESGEPRAPPALDLAYGAAAPPPH